MRAPRFTLRVLVIGVAFAALATWGYSLGRRSAECAAKANGHWANLVKLSGNDGRSMGHRGFLVHPVGGAENAKRELRMQWIDYEERMYFKYLTSGALALAPNRSRSAPAR